MPKVFQTSFHIVEREAQNDILRNLSAHRGGRVPEEREQRRRVRSLWRDESPLPKYAANAPFGVLPRAARPVKAADIYAAMSVPERRFLERRHDRRTRTRRWKEPDDWWYWGYVDGVAIFLLLVAVCGSPEISVVPARLSTWWCGSS